MTISPPVRHRGLIFFFCLFLILISMPGETKFLDQTMLIDRLDKDIYFLKDRARTDYFPQKEIVLNFEKHINSLKEISRAIRNVNCDNCSRLKQLSQQLIKSFTGNVKQIEGSRHGLQQKPLEKIGSFVRCNAGNTSYCNPYNNNKAFLRFQNRLARLHVISDHMRTLKHGIAVKLDQPQCTKSNNKNCNFQGLRLILMNLVTAHKILEDTLYTIGSSYSDDLYENLIFIQDAVDDKREFWGAVSLSFSCAIFQIATTRVTLALANRYKAFQGLKGVLLSEAVILSVAYGALTMSDWAMSLLENEKELLSGIEQYLQLQQDTTDERDYNRRYIKILGERSKYLREKQNENLMPAVIAQIDGPEARYSSLENLISEYFIKRRDELQNEFESF